MRVAILGNMADAPDIRASDADRERVAAALRRHAGEGRLTLDELGERLGETYAARTLGELAGPAGPLRELPPLAPPTPPQILAAGHDGRRRGFPEHLASYLSVCALLVVIWALTGAGYFWPIWVIVFWGFGVLMHYLATRQRTLRPR